MMREELQKDLLELLGKVQMVLSEAYEWNSDARRLLGDVENMISTIKWENENECIR